ncbi:Putative histidine phosphatase superfamily, clade-1, 6-phosphofructo-2-kinase [Septoria linicola]|uniref:Histidine phosphatase superfamily, clade-1, 6-phosphofructo-2-kinase n=1 Tax=Septoria linicola TaxID=215465 RepID=A0A9Q9AP98_9PEZI|nr:putative histidine phosphatase superfamily, clade-1, 6-phosphofructo-2-kinase [Septoria linicola]USW49708.1 Putative histidine phosphatase superfamily, clade-1, 6-phosphofructo-2-kinase [Septoria linicola]
MPHAVPASNHNQSDSDSSSQENHHDGIDVDAHSARTCSCHEEDKSQLGLYRRRQSQTVQQSKLAQYAMTASAEERSSRNEDTPTDQQVDLLRDHLDKTFSNHARRDNNNGSAPPTVRNRSASDFLAAPKRLPSYRAGALAAAMNGTLPERTGATAALNDTPATTAPNSPKIMGKSQAPSSNGSDSPSHPSQWNLAPRRQNSGTSTPRVRPTTLDIPGLTKSKVSPDGRIAQRDVGSKLVIIMVGLPARGKSYITKKLARYLNWLQHDTRIFNVGERRRTVAGGPNSLEKTRSQQHHEDHADDAQDVLKPFPYPRSEQTAHHPSVAQIILNGETKLDPPPTPPRSNTLEVSSASTAPQVPSRKQSLATAVLSKDVPEKKPEVEEDNMEQNANFFDPQNKKASQIREQVARETLDELLDYILYENGSIGILDATNSTLARRKMIMDHIRERAGPQLNVLFLESKCVDQDLLEANMRLKLQGPDYREMDPTIALADFRKRVREYEKAYVSLGDYEENMHMPYIQMIDVGRKVISHQIKGFLMAQANYYLLNFNLAPRQIWITRHGLSQDNVSGKIGGDSDLASEGLQYAKSLQKFIEEKRKEWDIKQIENLKNTHFPPQPGDVTPPNPYYQPQSPDSEHDETASILTEASAVGYEPKSFCVWTSMLKRSIQTAQYFDDEEYDTKQMRMLDELNAGVMEGLTYSCISTQYPDEYRSRRADKLHYRYPGPGGEGYLDIINRLRPVIVELERMTDHVLLVGHRSVARVLLAYFRGLNREEVADLDVPLGMLYCLEPKPYGVDFKAYKWDKDTEWFYEVPNFQLRRAQDDMV